MKKEIILKSAELNNRYAKQLLTLYEMKKKLEQIKRK